MFQENSMFRTLRYLASLALLALLVACGGGGSSDTPFRAPKISTPTAGLLPHVGYVVVNIGETNRRPDTITIGLNSLRYDASNVVICAREIGSSASCGSPGTTVAQLLPSHGPITLDIWRLQSVASWVERKPIAFEIIFYRPSNFWVGDQFTFSISSAEFVDYDRTIVVSYYFPVMLIRWPPPDSLASSWWRVSSHKRAPSQGAFLHFICYFK